MTEAPKEYPSITRWASPVDTLYNLGFRTYGKDSPAYPGIRAMYNAAIDQPDTVAMDEESYKELQRQRKERSEKKQSGGVIDFYKNKLNNDFFE